MMNSFLWANRRNGGGGIRWMKWELLCKSMPNGGISFRNLHDINVAMLGKQAWKLLSNPESNWPNIQSSILPSYIYCRGWFG